MPHFGINQRCFPLTNCAPYAETVCDMLRLSVRLTPFSCAACAVFCKKNEIYVQPYSTGRKTKSRYVYLGEAARSTVQKYLAERQDAKPNDPLFISRMGQPMDRSSIRLMLNEAGVRANIKNVHPHRFRHTFAIEYLRNGGDVFTLQLMLGHSSLEMVEHYLYLANSDARTAHSKASPADKLKL